MLFNKFTKYRIYFMIKKQLQQLIEGESLTTEDAHEAVLRIGKGEVNTAQIAAFLMGIQQKGVTIDELLGFREAMLTLSLKIDLSEFDAMDIVGTGGDGKNTFNISTTSAFVVAGAGQTVAKHGNHGVSSAVGSSTVLEQLGVRFTANETELKNNLEKANICFFHAPLFHSAMKYAAPVRKELGIKTFFNLLGPLLNPGQVTKILTGVYHPSILPLYEGVLKQTGTTFGIVHSVDIYDEISLTSDFIYVSNKGTQTFSPEKIGFRPLAQSELYGEGNAQDSAQIMLNVLQNNATEAQKSAVTANAAFALQIAQNYTLEEAIAKATESIESGNAYRCFKELTKTA